MAIVERGNVVLEIADDDIQRYLDKGYSVTDGKGTILQRTTNMSVGELNKVIAEKDAEILQLKEQIKALTVEKPKRQKKTQAE